MLLLYHLYKIIFINSLNKFVFIFSFLYLISVNVYLFFFFKWLFLFVLDSIKFYILINDNNPALATFQIIDSSDECLYCKTYFL